MTTTQVQTIHWTGNSGKKYKYWIHPIGWKFKGGPGNYAFTKETKNGTFVPIYFGETGDLSDRFDNHHKKQCILQHGATHIHVHTSSAVASIRRAEESDLNDKWNPVCKG